MNRLSAGFAAAALAVASLASYAAPNVCTKSPCQVVIIMPADCGKGIAVAPDPLVIKIDGAATIEWTLMDDTWAFDGENGIVIHDPTRDFQPAKMSSGPSSAKKMAFGTRGKTGKTYKYDVNLTRGGVKCTLDPSIMN